MPSGSETSHWYWYCAGPTGWNNKERNENYVNNNIYATKKMNFEKLEKYDIVLIWSCRGLFFGLKCTHLTTTSYCIYFLNHGVVKSGRFIPISQTIILSNFGFHGLKNCPGNNSESGRPTTIIGRNDSYFWLSWKIILVFHLNKHRYYIYGSKDFHIVGKFLGN